MGEVQRRQFGFTFLLFVPILAYWSYGTFRKWYASCFKSKSTRRSTTTNTKKIYQSKDQGEEAKYNKHCPLALAL